MEEFRRRQGPHQCVDPHRHDEQDDGHSAFIELLVRQDPCGRVAEQDAQGSVLYRHLKREGEGLDGILVHEELHEVAEGEMSAAVPECIEDDQDQWKRDKQHQKYRIGQGP